MHRRPGRFFCFAVLAATLLAPTAAAELRIASVTAPDAPLAPEVERGSLDVTVELDCSSYLLRLDPAETGVPLTVTIESDDFVIVTGPTRHLFHAEPQECALPGAFVVSQLTFEVAVTQDAPGLLDHPITFNASVAPDPLGFDPAAAQEGASVQAAPNMVLQAKVAESLARTKGPIDFPVEITNFGNVPVTVSLEEGESKGTIAFADVSLMAAGRPDSSVATAIRYTPPDGSWKHDAVELALVAREASTGETADPVKLSLLVRNDSFLATPGPGVAWLGALLLLGAARRR